MNYCCNCSYKLNGEDRVHNADELVPSESHTLNSSII